MVEETAEARLKRMTMRSWRRGTKEMDLVFGPYADANIAKLSTQELDLYDRLLAENDQDLMTWIFGPVEAPAWTQPLLGQISEFAQNRLRNR